MVLGNSESKPKVAFLGPLASYSHQATMGCFSADEYEYEPCLHIKDIFDAVQSGFCPHGIIPFENSTNGPVAFTLDLLADRDSLYPDVVVYDETYVDVHHYLLGNLPPSHDSTPTLSSSSQFDSSRSEQQDSGTCTPTMSDPNPLQPRSKPLRSLSHINKLYSHPQAWGQCELFLQTYLKGIQRIDVSSTSHAAEIVKEDKTGRSAAISSKAASEVHHVNVLARGIEDKADNCTRFLVIKKLAQGERDCASTNKAVDGLEKDIGQMSIENDGEGSSISAMKSLVSFTVDHRSPGALADVLECFRRYGLNLTSINSRPSKAIPFQYIFFVEVEENTRDGDGDGKVKKALEDVNKVATAWRWLGTWRDRLNGRLTDLM